MAQTEPLNSTNQSPMKPLLQPYVLMAAVSLSWRFAAYSEESEVECEAGAQEWRGSGFRFSVWGFGFTLERLGFRV